MGGGGKHYIPIPDEEFWKPVAVFIKWSREYKFYIGEQQISFFEIWTFGLLCAILFGFFYWIFDNFEF